VIAPFFLFGSLFLGYYLQSQTQAMDLLSQLASSNVLTTLAAATIVTISLGYLIGAFSLLILRLLFVAIARFLHAIPIQEWSYFAKTGNYEGFFSNKSYDKIWTLLGLSGHPEPPQAFFAATTFVHSKTPEQIQLWLPRRWNTFVMSAHICVSLLLAHACGLLFGICQDWKWWLASAALIALFVANGSVAYVHTARMLSFQPVFITKEQPLR
jgi:hypothetical protein